jgi:hypothetical protein
MVPFSSRCAGHTQELAAVPRREGEKAVLLVGNPALPLKGFDVALAALSAVNRVLPLRVLHAILRLLDSTSVDLFSRG